MSEQTQTIIEIIQTTKGYDHQLQAQTMRSSAHVQVVTRMRDGHAILIQIFR